MSTRKDAAGSGADFFVSYTEPDRAWAEWIAWQIEASGNTAIIQAWDFVPGSYFVNDMHRATERAARTVMVLSRAYLDSAFAAAEWQSAWSADPAGNQGRLLAVRLAKESLARHRRLFGEDHPNTQSAAEYLSRIRASLSSRTT